MSICKECIHYEVCKHNATYVVAVSVPEIAEALGYSINFTRSIVRKLKEKELITSVCESGFNESIDRYVIVRGYALTEKATQTDSYQKALYELTEQ